FPSTLLCTGSFIERYVLQRSLRPRLEKHGSASGVRNGGRGRAAAHALVGDARKSERESGALSGNGRASQLPPVLLGDFLGEREPQAGASLLGGEEGVEDAREPRRLDARAGVLDLDQRGAVLRAGGHRQRAAAGH